MCLQVFTTCGSDRKKQYLLDTFPQLRADHIGHSRDCSFEDLIMHKVRLYWRQCSLSCMRATFAAPETAPSWSRPWSCTRCSYLGSSIFLVLAWHLLVQKTCNYASLMFHETQSWNAATNLGPAGTLET